MAAQPDRVPSPLEPEGADTRTRLLDAAEHLFAEHGIASTSVRRITAEAGANVAAVNYHFGSKSALIEDVYARRIRPLNEERLRRLRAVEKAVQDRAPTLEGILVAFLAPVQHMCADPERGGSSFLKLMARANLEPTDEVYRLIYRQFSEVGMQFFQALRGALPHLDPADIFVRFRFMLGAMFFTFAHVMDPAKVLDRSELLLPPELTSRSDDSMLHDLVAFLAAGFRAPTPEDV